MKTEENRNISRRDYLKGVAVGTAGAVTLGMVSGCQPKNVNDIARENNAATNNSSRVVAGSGQKYEVINSDILIIGAGNLGVHAAVVAISEGRNVTIIDKGLFRHNGVSGMSWDYFLGKDSTKMMQGLGMTNIQNGKAVSNAMKFMNEPNRFIYQVNHGQTLPDRDENGQYIPFLTDDRTQGQFCRRHMDNLLASPRINVIDRTMITDLFISDGKCYGAMGIHLPTGDFRVFRSNATVLATGGCTQIYGWLSVGPYSINVPDNTSDAEMAAFRHGVGIVGSEFANYDCMSIYPPGLGTSFGAGVCGDAQEPQTIFDKDGELLFDLNDEKVWTDRNYFCQFMAKAIEVDGRGTENKGVYLSIGDANIRYGNERNLAVLEKFGINAREEKIEASPEMFEHGGSPQVDENMMTEIPGLFCGRNSHGGTGVAPNYYFGRWVGHTASEYAKVVDPAEKIDWSAVDVEYDRLNEIRSRKTSNSLRPHVIRQAIQEAGFKGLGVWRTTEVMEESLAEITRIRKEDLPRMAPADDSTAFNTEWRDAIENYNLLDLAEMSLKASLLREDTRGAYVRAEFPAQDDTNWNCSISCHNVNGEMKLDKITFDPFDNSVLG